MIPGATTRPSAFNTWRPFPVTLPTSVIRPPLTATSPWNPGRPEPSITLPFLIIRSCAIAPPVRHAAAGRCGLTPCIGTKLFDDSITVNIKQPRAPVPNLGVVRLAGLHDRVATTLFADYTKLPNHLFDSEDILKQFDVSIKVFV